MSDRAALPDWPRLMSVELAARYFSVSVNTFRSWGLSPIEQGRRVLYDRRSLDRYADFLAGQPLSPAERRNEASEVERRFLESRRSG